MKNALGFVWWCITCLIVGFAIAGVAAIYLLYDITVPFALKAGDGPAAAMLLVKAALISSFFAAGLRLIFGSRPVFARQILEHQTVGGQ